MRSRPYTLRQRAATQEATRQRIIEAAMHLHEEVGPRNTTISAVAERAGVQRLTVYRHFPDERDLFQACTGHWLSLHPLPDPNDWAGIADGLERCRAALTSLYLYFRATQRMWVASYRDEGDVAALHEPMQRVRDYLSGVAAGLAAGVTADGARADAVGATLSHAVQFATWASLTRLSLSDAEAATLATQWVAGLLGTRVERQVKR